ncbi:MAG: serine/threonine protein kinase [Deltaproteobacteria bacterium]|nr:serine/threonine protein kinase [Deltaproteobacteria bacterium]
MGETLLGKYDLVEKLATGGMAEVFLARTRGIEGFEKWVAIKRILPHLAGNREFARLLINEAKLAARLSHVNIVQIFDFGQVGGTYFLAMEYVAGRDLRTVLARSRTLGQRLTLAQVLFVMAEVCRGLAYAHRKRDDANRHLRIVHRDVSPQNILVSYEGEVKIADFGIARAASIAYETQSGVLRGKLSYMAPEQALGVPVDQRADLYSAGIILYEMLTGVRLFRGATDLETLALVREPRIVPPRAHDPAIPEALEEIVLKALAPRREERYQQAEEMHGALAAFAQAHGLSLAAVGLGARMHELFKEERAATEARPRPGAGGAAEAGTRTLRTPSGKRPLPSLSPPVGGPRGRPIRRSPGRLKAGMALAATLLTVAGVQVGLRTVPSSGPPARPTAFASLTVRVDPVEAEVYLNKQRVGVRAPVTVDQLPAGDRYILEALSDGYEPFRTTVLLDPGEVRVIQVALQRLADRGGAKGTAPPGLTATGAGPSVLRPTVAPGPRPTSRQGRTRPDTRTFPSGAASPVPPTASSAVQRGGSHPLHGSVSVTSTPPGARVYLDQQAVGVTPLEIGGLSTGRQYRIRVQQEGYREWAQPILLEQAERREIRATLDRAFGTLNINAIPWAEVHWEGRLQGVTPLIGIRLPAGSHRLRVVNPALNLEREVAVRIEADQVLTEVVSLLAQEGR